MSVHGSCLLSLPAARVRGWLRLLLLCSLFSALHAPLGGWVLATFSQQVVVQVCTPQGMQWVALDDVDAGRPEGEHSEPTVTLQPCAWAASQSALPGPALTDGVLAGIFGGPVGCVLPDPPPSDHVSRVLLMSPMRAPPQVA